jgi:hypothetical protein
MTAKCGRLPRWETFWQFELKTAKRFHEVPDMRNKVRPSFAPALGQRFTQNLSGLFLHGLPMLGRPHAQLRLYRVIELPDRQCGHASNDSTAVNAFTPAMRPFAPRRRSQIEKK